MWTNVFRIGGLQQVSWFQFLPHESGLKSLPDRSFKVDQKDAATLVVLSSHQQLQKEGFLSAWTNCFVGPWDPSQGIHNPDEKLKLWLFLPGRHSTVAEKAQAAVSRLRVLASGLWLAPGDSEEVAAALSQALRNCIERALAGLSYVRFGDVFSRYHPFSQSEELFRRGQLVVEFVFAASEEAVFVHVVVTAKHIRTITSGDMETISERSSSLSHNGLPVIVSPHGMHGKLTGCCPGDLVQQVYTSAGKLKASNGVLGLLDPVSQGSSCKLRGQSCYLEVTVGCSSAENEKIVQANLDKNISGQNISESSAVTKDAQKGSARHMPVCEKTFIYPAEVVLVPVVQTSFAKSSLKRFWLQNWMGPSLSGSSFLVCHDIVENLEGSWINSSGIHSRRSYRSSSNSNSSSISSSSTSSDSDYKMNTGAGDLEADADSLTCGQSGLSSADQVNNDGRRLGNKRTRAGMTDSFSQAGALSNVGMQGGSIEVNASVSSGVAKEHLGWDWDDDDRGVVMDIQSLLSEFGDFGDFFENDNLPFGEPPGTTDSQDIVVSTPDGGDIASNSPYTGMLDVPEQMSLPVEFSSFESFNPPPLVIEDSVSKSQLLSNDAQSSDQMDYTPASSLGEFNHLIKAEALMTFAPEYGAVETLKSEISSSIFGNPYIPKSRKANSETSTSNNYVYSATPPSPFLAGSDEKKAVMSLNVKVGSGRYDAIVPSYPKNYYTHVESVREQNEKRLLDCSSSISSREYVPPSTFSGFKSTNSIIPVENKVTESTSVTDNYLLSTKTVLANEVECIMFQAYMCKMRHTLLSSSSFQSVGYNRQSGSSVLNHLHNDPSILLDNISGKYEVKKKESIPVRIAGDIDRGILESPLNAVGVWRSVGVSKGSKPLATSMEVSADLPHNSFNEESLLLYGQRQPLQELLNAMPLLVQQATSFVDVALDADCNDGPYGWLALQEQWRRGFSCGPSMVHAGCGGVLASSHSLDIAGVELVDPLAANVQASSAITLIQSDIKAALKSAFGNSDGPLLVTDWCCGRSQSGDAGVLGDAFSAESSASVSECRDSASNTTLSGVEPVSPLQSAGASSFKDGSKVDETSERRSNQDTSISESEQQLGSRLGPTLLVLPFPAILVGYQDDWLKTAANSLQVWEKAPLEPYAMQKHMAYCVVCPDIDPLATATADFFQQLGTVYETCKLGTHSPQSLGNHMEVDSRKLSSSGFVLLDCPQSMKIESNTSSLVGSISDYFLSLSSAWDLTKYLKSLSNALKSLSYSACLTSNAKEGINGPCMVIYVVCPFPEPISVLKTIIEASAAIGSVVLSADKERRNVIHNHVGKALSCLTAIDETSIANVVTLSGFSIPKLVLQVVTVDAIFRVTTPTLNELVLLKEIAFTVYNKARRVSRGSTADAIPSSTSSGRSNSALMQVTSVPGMWKDCDGSRMTGPSSQREAELDATLRAGNWDSSWQMPRSGGLGFDSNVIGDLSLQDEVRYMFEPLFILAEPGSPERGVPALLSGNLAYESSKMLTDDGTSGDTGPSSQFNGPTTESYTSGNQKPLPSLHCCYGWTEDWRWLVCIWTDSKGELLDSYIFPFGGISSRQDTKGLQLLFVQILQQGCKILQACSPDTGIAKPRDFVITRIGCFFELECQEWQKALYSIGGSEVRKWPVQLRRSTPDGIPPNSNGNTMQQQELSMMQDRTMPSSPSPLYSSHSKASSYMKGSMGQPSARKQLMGGHTAVDNSRGLLQWVQSISFVSASVNHSLHFVLQADSASSGATQGSSVIGQSGYLEGFTPVKSLGSTSSSYILVPSPSMRFLSPTPLQLPTCLTSESPPLAHLLHSKGSAIPLSTGFVVSKAVPSMRKDTPSSTKEEWPSVLSVNLVDYYGGNNISQEKLIKGVAKTGGRGLSLENREVEREAHLILETVAAELHALSWMTVSPAYLERRTALPFHCDMVLRLQRLLHFADKEVSRLPEKAEG
ncbi:mediator of RNA polymerase II transcription subunit 13 [Daucus carota subsp. sativus]|uniref:mediator of RNA polymerase II transcription subunit 13 n=1 Tax=Daucus carota subsp. sativus TaxID=79200 RepID=UPI0007EFC831|nr:PREDICTED: mediator of RNA polymerase II transcription subunit 13 [Daucus carota subsp. sativus]